MIPVKEIIDSIDNIVEEIPTSVDKSEQKNKLTDLVFNAISAAMTIQSQNINVEANGNFLQRSWRPITMLSFVVVLIYQYFVSQVFKLPSVTLPDRFFDLLEIGLGGYVIGRTVEKVAETVTQKIDYPFIKKT